MAPSLKNCVVLLAVAAALCTQLCRAHDIFGRCSCDQTVKFVADNITDFQVLERRPACDKTELIVTRVMPDNSTNQVCMNTSGRMAQAFLKCWERINKDKSRKMECIARLRRAQ